METLKFKIVRKETPVEIIKDETTTKCVLREFDGVARDAYMDSILKDVVLDGTEKETNIKLKGSSVVGIQATLVALCLVTEADNKPVPIEVIQTYQPTVIDALYEACQELNGLGDKEKKDEKIKNV